MLAEVFLQYHSNGLFSWKLLKSAAGSPGHEFRAVGLLRRHSWFSSFDFVFLDSISSLATIECTLAELVIQV